MRKICEICSLRFRMIESFMLIATIGLCGKTNYNLGSQTEVKLFKNLERAFIIYLVADILWALLVYEQMWKSFLLLHIVSVLDIAFLGIMPYLWFVYVEEILKSNKLGNSVFRKFCNIIIIAYFCLIISNFKTGYMYRITDNFEFIMYARTFDILLVLVGIFYGGATLHGIITFLTSNNRIMRKKALMVIAFIVPIGAGVVGYYKYSLSICVAPSIFTSILMYFLAITDEMIYIDNLTGLFNRKKLISLGEEKQILFSEKNALMLYYIDLDKFKHINDQYGHLEGDKVLKTVGNALKNLDYEYNSVSVRMGGDEFLLAVQRKDITDIDVKSVIRDEIRNEAQKSKLPYGINMSIGQACCDDSARAFNSYIKEADKDMYREKKCAYKEELS